MKKKLILLFLIAFFIRLIALNQSLWLDEGTTAKVVKEYSYINILTKFSPFDFHPPLYYWTIKAWTTVFGYSEVSLRFPSVVFSLLTGWFIYKICRLRKSLGEPVWAAAFFLLNPLIVYYSQEARMYMMATFLLTVAIYFLLRKKIILFNLFNSLAFLTFYGSVFLTVPLFLVFIYKKKYQAFIISCLFFGATCLLLSPLLLQQFIHSREALKTIVNWRQILGNANLKNLLLIPLKFSFGRISFSPKIIYYLVSFLWSAFVFYLVIRGSLKNKILGFLFLFPIFLGLIFSLFSPLLQYFRFLYLIPVMVLLISIATKKNIIYQYIIFSGFIILSFVYFLNPMFWHEDWKSLAKILPAKNVYMISASADALKYYNPSLQINDLLNINTISPKEQQIVVIPYTSDIYGFDYRKILNSFGFQIKGEHTVRGLSYELWMSFR